MFNTIRSRFNWQSRKTRLVVAAAVCAAGLGIGLGSSGLLTQRAMAEPPASVCEHEYTGSAACPGAFSYTSWGEAYVCIPCANGCSTGYAAGYVNANSKCATAASDYVDIFDCAGGCVSPPPPV